jgi:uncharacterized Tic20 family protein
MLQLSINWFAVAVCAVLCMVSGSLWYNPRTFFLVWWKGIGKTDAEDPGGKQSMNLIWVFTVLSCIVQAVFMAYAVSFTGQLIGGATLVSGVLTGLFLWAGFVAPTYLVNKLFAGHGFKIWAIETGNHLVNFVLFGAILGLWH